MSQTTVVRQDSSSGKFKVVNSKQSLNEVVSEHINRTSVVTEMLCVLLFLATQSVLAIVFVFGIAEGVSNTTLVILQWCSQLAIIGRICWPVFSLIATILALCVFCSVGTLSYVHDSWAAVWTGGCASWLGFLFLFYEFFNLFTN